MFKAQPLASSKAAGNSQTCIALLGDMDCSSASGEAAAYCRHTEPADPACPSGCWKVETATGMLAQTICLIFSSFVLKSYSHMTLFIWNFWKLLIPFSHDKPLLRLVAARIQERSTGMVSAFFQCRKQSWSRVVTQLLEKGWDVGCQLHCLWPVRQHA